MVNSENIFLWEYGLPVLVGIVLISFFPSTKHYQNSEDKKKYYMIQAVTLVAAILGAKLVGLSGDHYWPMMPVAHWKDIIYSSRSLVGGLFFGFLVAELCKPLFKYKLPPNDRFAMILPVSVAVGRVGCLLAGCCRGIPYEGPFAITYSDFIARHPMPAYEITFHLSIALVLVLLVRRGILTGRIFAIYLMSYGAFRFISEFLRVTPKTFFGHSLYQWLSVALFILGLLSLLLRSLQKNRLNAIPLKLSFER
jgi:phosphatidylglycerol---prolipoprotein diacylglyceryl transferase